MDKARVKELQAHIDSKMAENQAMVDSMQKTDEGAIRIEPEHKAAFDRNLAEIKEASALLKGLKEMEDIAAWGAQPASDSVSMAAAAQTVNLVIPEQKTLGQMFLESDEFKALQGGRAGANMPAPFQLKAGRLGDYNVKDVYTALPTGTPGSFGQTVRDPMVLRQHRKTRVRDLFPSRTTTAAVIEYFRVTGFTNNAAPVVEYSAGEFGLKAQSTLAFKGEQAPVRTIAHWEAAHRNVLADEPQLRAIIDNELLYGLRLVEDDQILNGDGTGENLLGVTQAPGIQTYNWSDGALTPVPDTKGDALRRAATLAFLAYYEPTGIVLHPNDWEDIELTKNSQGNYLMAISMQQGAEARIWRLPIIDTPAMTEGRALLGAFGTGAQLYDREQANIRISEQHADFFVRNAIVVLAEERLALAVKRPEAFVYINFDAEPSST